MTEQQIEQGYRRKPTCPDCGGREITAKVPATWEPDLSMWVAGLSAPHSFTCACGWYSRKDDPVWRIA